MKKIVLVIVCLIIIKFVDAQSSLCFNSSTLTSNPVGANPAGITHADFNNDGKIDLAVCNQNSNNVSILLNIGNGNFGPAANYSVGTEPLNVKTSDFNEDGFIDVVVMNSTSGNVSVLLGIGNGTFNSKVDYYVGGNLPTDIVCSDFNGDNHFDLAITNKNVSYPSLNYTRLLIGDGLGTFTLSPNVLSGSQPNSLACADFNGDGKSDLAVANYNTNNVSIFSGNGVGGFSSAVSYTIGSGPLAIKCADFNGDAIIDLVITADGNKIYVLIGTGSGNFAPSIPYDAGGYSAKSISTVDLNGDGKMDIVLPNVDNIAILNGTGTGTFLPPNKYASNGGLGYITEADFNNDGAIDLAVSRSKVDIYLGDGSGGLLLEPLSISLSGYNYSRSFTSGDFNSDGKKDFAFGNFNNDSITVILANGSNTYASPTSYYGSSDSPLGITVIASADFNNDGKVDIAYLPAGHLSLIIKLGNGLGGFLGTISYTTTTQNQGFISIADYNNDGNTDIAISAQGSFAIPFTGVSALCVFLGNGNGTFTIQNYNFNTGFFPNSITSTDLNNDGNLDIVIGASDLGNGTNLIYKFIGNGLGGFTSTSFNYNVIPRSIASGDFNKDGNADLAISKDTLNGISVFLGNGTGFFGSPITLAGGRKNVQTILIEDFNHDGNLDIVSNELYTGNITFFLGNGNGTFAVGKTYNVGFYICNEQAGTIICNDYNKDGVVDLAILGEGGNGGFVSVLLNKTASISLATPACIGSIAKLQATKDADSYTWSPNLSTSDTMSISANGVYSVTLNYVNNFCGVNTSTINVVFNPTPTITATSSQSITCSYSSNTLTANGAHTYTWSSGVASQSIIVNPTVTATYSVIGTNTLGCSNSQTVSVTVDNTCQDVWPGDANSDGLADNLDVLELGLHYTQTGTARATTSNLWQSYYSANWSGTITNGKNMNHSNCNGDGIINDDDTLAIFNNYSLTHAFKPDQTTTNPALTIIPDQSAVAKGTWGTASINLGNITSPISNINGIAYTVNYDNTLFETDSVWLEYPTSFINASNQNLKFRKRDFTNGKLFTATTHTISGNVNGYGKIATLHYKIKSTLAIDNVLNLSISQANQSNASGAITPLTAGSTSLMAIGASVGINELINGSYLSISPNPANDLLSIELKTTNDINATIEITNTLGQVVLSSSLKNNKEVLNITHLSNGVYFVKVLSINKQIGFKKIVVQR
jgi:hypothetical protein